MRLRSMLHELRDADDAYKRVMIGDLREAAKQFEPRARLENVTFYENAERANQGVVQVQLNLRIVANEEALNLTFPWNKQGGG